MMEENLRYDNVNDNDNYYFSYALWAKDLTNQELENLRIFNLTRKSRISQKFKSVGSFKNGGLLCNP